jgi:hypothetical protein
MMNRVRFLVGQDFSLCHNTQTESEPDPASHPVGTEALSPGVKRPGHEADHSPVSSGEVKNASNYKDVSSLCCILFTWLTTCAFALNMFNHHKRDF